MIETIKQTLTIPKSLEVKVKLPEDAIPDEMAEIVVSYHSKNNRFAEKLAQMELAKNDELLLADILEIEADFNFADAEVK